MQAIRSGVWIWVTGVLVACSAHGQTTNQLDLGLSDKASQQVRDFGAGTAPCKMYAGTGTVSFVALECSDVAWRVLAREDQRKLLLILVNQGSDERIGQVKLDLTQAGFRPEVRARDVNTGQSVPVHHEPGSITVYGVPHETEGTLFLDFKLSPKSEPQLILIGGE